jgi:hypothetical protein
MRLPNKVTSYSKSAIAWFPSILSSLKEKDMPPQDLMEALVTGQANMGDFLDALDCLYALNKIELTDEGRLLRYVEANPM